MTVASVSMVALYLVSALDYGFGWSHVPAVVSLIANIFVLLGFAGIFWTFRENAYAAATVRVERDQPVISTGPYALVRHPMYAAALPLFVATPPALGSWYGLIPAAACRRPRSSGGSSTRNGISRAIFLAMPITAPRFASRLVPGVW